MTDASRRIEFAFSAFVLLVAVAGFVAVPNLVSGWAFVMPGTTDAALAPTFFPRLAMAVLGLAAMNVMLTSPARASSLPVVEMGGGEWKRTFMVVLFVLAYLATLSVLGFIIASALFLVVTSCTLGYRNYLAVLAVAIMLPVVTAALFRYALSVILPAGLLQVGF